MWNLLKLIRRDRRDDETQAALDGTIEQVVDGTDPRLRLTRGYRKKLHDPVARTLAYADFTVDSLPPAVELSRYGYAADPRIRAYFASVGDLRDRLGASEELRAFFERAENRTLDECYAMLRMNRDEKHVLGVALEGDMIRREVAQVTVNFRDQRIVAPAASEAEVRRELKERIIKFLITCALERIASLHTRRQELEAQRALLQAKLHAAQASGRGLDALFRFDEYAPPAAQGAEETRHRLEEVEQALRQAVADLQTLDNYLEQIGQVLGNPERHLHGRKVELLLDSMNIKLEHPAPGQGVHHTLYEVAAEDGRCFDVVLVKCVRAELPPKESFLERARPYLG